MLMTNEASGLIDGSSSLRRNTRQLVVLAVLPTEVKTMSLAGVGRVGAVGSAASRGFCIAGCVLPEVASQIATVWVPAETFEASGLRRLTTKVDLSVYRDLLKGRPLSLDKDHARRRLELIERMKQGSFKALCELVRDLTARGWSKPLGGADAASLRKAHDHLCQEWAAAEGVPLAEATQEVDAFLLEAKKSFE